MDSADKRLMMVEKLQKHKDLCQKLNDTYTQKNSDYGDSFSQTFNALGLISAITRISDKYNRVCNLALSNTAHVKDETIVDTLMDMANYCLMTVMELEERAE